MDARPGQEADREATTTDATPAWLCTPAQPAEPPAFLRYVPLAALAFGLLSVAVLWTAIVFGLRALEHTEREAAESTLANLARSFEGHVERSLLNIGQVLTVVAQETARHGAPADLADLLGERLRDDPLFSQVAVTDARGRVLTKSRGKLADNLAERDFFVAQRERPDGGLFIGRPVPGQGGEASLPLAERIFDRAGGFGGVAVATVDSRYFTDFYAGFDLGPGSVVALVGLDGVIRARHAQGAGAEGIGQDIATPRLRQIVELHRSGHYRGTSTVDGLRRLYAYRVMDHFPLVVLVGMAEDHAFADLQRRRRDMAALGAAVTAIIAALTAFLYRQSGRLYRAERETCRALAQVRLNAKVFEESSDGIMITDARNNIVAVNRAFTEITGYAEGEVLGRNPRFLGSGATPAETYGALWQGLREEGRWEGEVINRRKDGEKYPEWLSINVVRDAQGTVTHYIGIFSDATARRYDQRRLHFVVHYDPLTELPNRLLLFDRLGQAIAQAKREGSGVAVLFLDLDNFKAINDRHGHAVGDRYLHAVARRWRAALRETDTLARLGGDEFILVVSEVDCRRYAEVVAEKCRAAIAEPFAIDGLSLQGSVSIGIALYPEDGDDGQALVSAADHAMYRAKANGRDGVRAATPADRIVRSRKAGSA